MKKLMQLNKWKILMDRFDLLYLDQLEPIKECYFNKQDKLASRYKSPIWHLYANGTR